MTDGRLRSAPAVESTRAGVCSAQDVSFSRRAAGPASDLIRWSQSSSFGNFLNELDSADLQRVRERLALKLEAHRTPRGIQLERYLVFRGRPAP